jgi:hypothetical protein
MNYLKMYDNLMDSCKGRVKVKNDSKEWHHIIPRSHGGSDDPSNLVLLTVREHVIAHWLLTRIHPKCYKMACAFKLMIHTRDGVRITPKMVEAAKKAINATHARGYDNAVHKEGNIYIVNLSKTRASHTLNTEMFGRQFVTVITNQDKLMDTDVCERAYNNHPEIFYGAVFGDFTVRQLYSYDGSVKVCGWKNGKSTATSLKTLLEK